MIQYIETRKYDNWLELSLNNEGRNKLEDFDQEKMTDEQIFLELFEYQLCNGWEKIEPENIGALTDSVILSDEMGNIYWFPEYMILDYIEALKNITLLFVKA